MTENERIREIRKTLNLTLEKFGERVGVTRASMSNVENGNRNVTEQMRKAICREFGVNYIWLTTENGYMFEELTEQQKILKYTGLLLRDKDSVIANAIQTLIVTYEQLDDTSKATLEKIALQYINNLKRASDPALPPTSKDNSE